MLELWKDDVNCQMSLLWKWSCSQKMSNCEMILMSNISIAKHYPVLKYLNCENILLLTILLSKVFMMLLSNVFIVKWCCCQMTSLWNDAVVKCLNCEMILLSSVLIVKWCCCQMSSLWNDPVVKCLHCEMSCCQMSSLWNDPVNCFGLWNDPVVKEVNFIFSM